MGKWVNVDDEKNTSALDLKKIATKLMTASMKSKTDVSVELRQRIKELNQPTVEITFFKDNNNFTITLYGFYSVEKNTKAINNALALMKNNSKFEEIDKKQRDERYD